MLLALIFVVRAAAAVSASLSDFESCGEFCDWIPYAGRVETDCRFSVRVSILRCY